MQTSFKNNNSVSRIVFEVRLAFDFEIHFKLRTSGVKCSSKYIIVSQYQKALGLLSNKALKTTSFIYAGVPSLSFTVCVAQPLLKPIGHQSN